MALPIGDGQTISPPFVVAYMTQQLDPRARDKVLEIGTGSGYQAAVLSPLVAEVYSIEIVPTLGRRAARTLKRLGYENVHTKVGDGYQGWAEHAPFDKIIVTCSPEKVPRPLVEQLAEGGRLIVPLGERYQQTLYLFEKREGELVETELLPTLFVPMTGAAEDRRDIQPDPARPEIYNGGFEEVAGETGKPAGWHYVRQAEVVADEAAPAGTHYLRFINHDPGRGSQALQGMAVDGRQVTELGVSLAVRAAAVRPGGTLDQLPMLVVTFYDARRATVGRRTLGPWRGSFDWRSEQKRLSVPPQAREAIVHIGLLGATGELALDDVQLRVVER
jgi:protein-L-isoaspartate(D-aspartate) O-methyltransferase